MRILIDTNIFIPMEDSAAELDGKLAELHRLASGVHQLLIHPASRDDIKRDKNERRRDSMLTRLEKYRTLESPPVFTSDEEMSLYGDPKKDNDRVDNLILLSLHKNCVHWLVTQDEGIHKKARFVGDYERVFTVDHAISTLLKEGNERHKLYPNIEDVPCHSLDLKNRFFDSLRDGYEGFDTWFIRQCSQTGRRAWAYLSDEDIHSVAIYKHENDPVITDDCRGLPGNAVKLCTFKVVKRGFKIGELMLKQAFNYAITHNVQYIYVTIAPGEHAHLENLFIEFGFYLYGVDRKGRDRVFVKEFPVSLPETDDSPLDYAIKYYPAIKLDNNRVFVIPIKPQYHDILFPELQIQSDMFSSLGSSAGNAIKQAYLCKSPIKKIAPGDIIFFYRTQDQMSVTTYGVVDQFFIEDDVDKIYQWVSKRTVYSYREIQEMVGGGIKVILFRLVRHIESPVTYRRLLSLGIAKGPIQSVITLSEDNAINLLEESQINDCFISN
ncbi:hypothetical protein [Zhongshania sp.]|jgi:hypothetical protein|uniref:hypothetical protein n=1 Tax=Zhongshania sp. TaxID=1971902 RepID=UPI001B4E63AF|nr:hypothetical protein [Zhongshania sp.]MBQ0795090.1 hypothetical protein [Zhongshania sp.]